MEARRLLEQLKEEKSSPKAKELTRNAYCQVCEFRARCREEAVEKDHLSLLGGMSEAQLGKYRRRGIFTVAQLSFTFRPPKRGAPPPSGGRLQQPALKALAVRDKKIYVLGAPRLPSPAGRIFFDLEGDPDRGGVYLLGMIVDAEGVSERHSFWSDGPEGDRLLFRQFLDIARAYPDFHLYSYGSYELAFLRRMSKLVGDKGLLEGLMSRLVNVLSVVHAYVYFPTHSNGLKDIGRYLGYAWSHADASGIQSIVWRRRWEETGDARLKDRLIEYNLEDCEALKRVHDFLFTICPTQPVAGGEQGQPEDAHLGNRVERVAEMDPELRRRQWCSPSFSVDDFQFINERAYFDYQQDRVFLRTSKTHKQRRAREVARKGRRDTRVTRCVVVNAATCPSCGGRKFVLTSDGRLKRLAFDLTITRNGGRRSVTRYTTSWHLCRKCKKRFLPTDYLRLEEHCHALKSWAMYEHVAHRASLGGIAERLHDLYDLPVSDADVSSWQEAMARAYETTHQRLKEKIVSGSLIHADETEVHLKRAGKAYVWVFTNLEEVIFLVRPSREAGFLGELLGGFRGVLVSDFYSGYDSLPCEQQKCLVHLIRDFNEDLRQNPWDDELKELASEFGVLLRVIVATVDRYGLKTRHLGKHQRDVAAFYNALRKRVYRSELADGYRKRLDRWRDKLFTFLAHDGIPWNNNNAEHAIKRFAKYRVIADGMYSEAGLKQYLLLLSLNVTCKYKKVSFLKFLLSRQVDIDAFARTPHARKEGPELELYGDDVVLRRPSRRQTWARERERQDEP